MTSYLKNTALQTSADIKKTRYDIYSKVQMIFVFSLKIKFYFIMNIRSSIFQRAVAMYMYHFWCYDSNLIIY